MSRPIRVAIAGAMGHMGTVARSAFAARDDVTYVAGFARAADAGAQIVDSLDALFGAQPDVLLDLTTHPFSVEVALAAVERGIPTVVGASGWSASERTALARAAEARAIGAMIVPNFAIGAVLMMRFAEQAARYFPASEIVEMHRAEKRDKPSGTALLTAERIANAGGMPPGVHSLRLPGAVAHQEVRFGGVAEQLTIRHDSYSRESFVAGMLAAVRAVQGLRGLTIGLDAVLDDARAVASTSR